MELGECLREGKIDTKDLFEFVVGSRELRTQCLSAGECYVLMVPVGKRDYIKVERVVELDSPERGDFVTEGGTTGPIRGSMFIRVSDGFSKYQLVMGDDVTPEGCVALKRLNEYVQGRIAS